MKSFNCNLVCLQKQKYVMEWILLYELKLELSITRKIFISVVAQYQIFYNFLYKDATCHLLHVKFVKENLPKLFLLDVPVIS